MCPDDTLTAAQRRDLIARANRQSATIGQELPETITVGDDDLPLEEFLIETRKVEGIPDDAKPLLRETERELTAERTHLVERLESAPIDREEGEAVVEAIVGIDRALNALRSLRRKGFGAEATSASLDDHERWLEFVNSAIANDRTPSAMQCRSFVTVGTFFAGAVVVHLWRQPTPGAIPEREREPQSPSKTSARPTSSANRSTR